MNKNKTTTNNRNDYAQYGKSKALTNTSTRDHVTSTFTCPATTVNWDRSWCTSSRSRPNAMLQPKLKPWQARKDSRQLNLSRPRWGLLKIDTLYPSPLVEPSRFTPAAAQLLPLSWGCLQNQALDNPELPKEDVDLVESAWSPGSGVVAQSLVHPMCHDRHVIPSESAVKIIVFPGCVGGPDVKKRLSSSAPEHSSYYRSASNGVFSGAHSLLFHCRLYQFFQLRGAQQLNSAPCVPHDPERHLILWTIKQTMCTHQRTQVDDTATILTAH